jgi:RNA polymerase-binding transcription factor DksA
LNTVVHALGKIEAGTYGVCEVSGMDIEEDRLEANPAARTCKAHMAEEATLP